MLLRYIIFFGDIFSHVGKWLDKKAKIDKQNVVEKLLPELLLNDQHSAYLWIVSLNVFKL